MFGQVYDYWLLGPLGVLAKRKAANDLDMGKAFPESRYHMPAFLYPRDHPRWQHVRHCD